MRPKDSHSYSLTHQLGPRYEGQLMSDGGAYSPFRSILLVLTHDFIITCVYGPTGSDGHERKDADVALCTIFLCRLRRRECCMLGAPFSQPTVPLHELPPARLVIHRQTSAHERRYYRPSVSLFHGYTFYPLELNNYQHDFNLHYLVYTSSMSLLPEHLHFF